MAWRRHTCNDAAGGSRNNRHRRVQECGARSRPSPRPAAENDAALLAIMHQRGTAGVAARLAALLEDLQPAAEHVVADLAIGDQPLADLGQPVGRNSEAYCADRQLKSAEYASLFRPTRFLTFPPPSLSLRWYQEFFGNPAWVQATQVSFGVAALTVLIATPLGVAAAYAI